MMIWNKLRLLFFSCSSW